MSDQTAYLIPVVTIDGATGVPSPAFCEAIEAAVRREYIGKRITLTTIAGGRTFHNAYTLTDVVMHNSYRVSLRATRIEPATE